MYAFNSSKFSLHTSAIESVRERSRAQTPHVLLSDGQRFDGSDCNVRDRGSSATHAPVAALQTKEFSLYSSDSSWQV